MKIADVRCFTVTGPAAPSLIEERQIGMLDIYPEYADRTVTRRSPESQQGAKASAVYVEVESDEGHVGLFGPIFAETAFLILAKLRSHLVGQDPLATERLWDVMYRQDRHARKGYQMMAISAVDSALWDLRGKAFGLPVYRLLGGPTREKIDCYASMLGHSLELDRVDASAPSWAVEQGFKAQKWFFRYGPSHGLEGMAKNVELVRTVREAVGPNIEIMFDSWMGLGRDLHHPAAPSGSRSTTRAGSRSPSRPTAPATSLRSASRRRVPIATGEHEYTRWGFQQLLQADAIDVIQADPDWCGGITELVKICDARLGVRARRDPARPLDPRRRPRHRRAVAVRLPDGRDAAAGAARQAAVPHRGDDARGRLDPAADRARPRLRARRGEDRAPHAVRHLSLPPGTDRGRPGSLLLRSSRDRRTHL